MYDRDHILEPLLVFAWQHGLFDREGLRTRDGQRVEIVAPGRRNSAAGPQFTDAEIRLGETIRLGSVALHERSSDWGFLKRNYEAAYDGVMLNVVAHDDRIVRKIDDSVLPSLQIALPERLVRAWRTLLAGAPKSACGCHLTRSLNEIEFKSACTRLMIDRLQRKFNDVMAIYHAAEKNWHETFHVLFFRSMGLGKNKEIYMSLARSAPYAKLCRERGEVQDIEAMLFGVAGLLDPSLYDEYKANLGKRFEVLRHRHQLRVMTYCEWSDRGVRPYNFVPKRIAQLASIINSNEFTFSRVLSCESVEEVRQLFRVELPDYWKRSFTFSSRSERNQRTIGEETIDILVINLIAPILFAYGRVEGDESLEERAIDFLYRTQPEKNRYTEAWRRHGVKIEHALASQSLIQLSTEFCLAQRCTECFLGSRILKNSVER
jgi:hypothetical protein